MYCGWSRWLAEQFVHCGVFGGWGRTQNVGDADGRGVGAVAEAAAVVAGEGGVPVEGNVERVDEAGVFGDVVAGYLRRVGCG